MREVNGADHELGQIPRKHAPVVIEVSQESAQIGTVVPASGPGESGIEPAQELIDMLDAKPGKRDVPLAQIVMKRGQDSSGCLKGLGQDLSVFLEEPQIRFIYIGQQDPGPYDRRWNLLSPEMDRNEQIES